MANFNQISNLQHMKLFFLLFSANVFCQTLTISISNGQLAEGQTGTFSVLLSVPSNVDTVVDIFPNVSFGTGGNDYIVNESFITIPAGQLFGNFTVTAIDDNIGEPTENFEIIALIGPFNGSNVNGFGNLIISDNDPNIVGEIVAADDYYYYSSGIVAGGQYVISNDTINGIPVTVNSVVVSPVLLPAGFQLLLPYGQFNFQGNEPDGLYIVKYQICAVSDLTNCKIATAFINIGNHLKVKNSTFENFIIFPNPASEKISINNNSKIDKIELVSTLGNKVYEKECKSFSFDLNIESLSKGLYFLKVFSGLDYEIFKIIKE